MTTAPERVQIDVVPSFLEDAWWTPDRAAADDDGTVVRDASTGEELAIVSTAGIDTAGAFYILTANLSLADRITGYRPAASDPPLVLGAGGKDGESIDLADALGRLLAP